MIEKNDSKNEYLKEHANARDRDMTLFIPKKYIKLYETDPLYDDKKKAELIKKRIAKKQIIVVSDEQWDAVKGLNK